MNFLGHLYVRTLDANFLTGSFIADAVKGRAIETLPTSTRQGVEVHRLLDSFTDQNPRVKDISLWLSSEHGRWSGIVADILLDHFLALHWDKYATLPLADFASNCYQVLQHRLPWLPAKTQRILPYMVNDNWLLNYADKGFLDKVFDGMHRRTQYQSTMKQATATLSRYYEPFDNLFQAFMPEVTAKAHEFIARLTPAVELDFRHQMPLFRQVVYLTKPASFH